MTNVRRRTALVLGPDAPLRRRDLGDGLGAHVDAAPGSPSSGPGAPGAPRRVAVHGSHFALVVLEGLDAGQRRHLHRAGRRRAGVAAGRDAAEPHPHARPDARAALRVRHLPHHRRARRGRATGRTASTRCAPSRWRCGTTPSRAGPTCSCCSATRCTPTPRRTPSSRSSWPRGAASTSRPAWRSRTSSSTPSCTGWRGATHVIRWVALDGALGDDLRRPRHPRRLEHLVVVATRDPRDDVVAGAHRLRARGLLGAPAPRQPLAGRAGPTRRSGDGGWSTRHRRRHRRARPHRALDALAARADAEPSIVPLELHPRTRRLCPRRHRLARRPRAAPRRPLDARRRRAALARRCAARRGAAPVRRHLPALPAAARACTTSRRSTRPWRRGPTAARSHGPPSGCAAASTSSTGRPSTRASTRSSSWSWRWRVANGARPRDTVTFLSGDVHNSYLAEVDDPLRLGRRLAHRPGRLLADPQPDAAGRACRSCRCSRSRSCARCGSSRRARGACPTRPTRGRSPTGRGSTTTSRS